LAEDGGLPFAMDGLKVLSDTHFTTAHKKQKTAPRRMQFGYISSSEQHTTLLHLAPKHLALKHLTRNLDEFRIAVTQIETLLFHMARLLPCCSS